MRHMKCVTAAFGLALLVGCATEHYSNLSENKNIWITVNKNGDDSTLFYCQANALSDGTSAPICTESKKIKVAKEHAE